MKKKEESRELRTEHAACMEEIRKAHRMLPHNLTSCKTQPTTEGTVLINREGGMNSSGSGKKPVVGSSKVETAVQN